MDARPTLYVAMTLGGWRVKLCAWSTPANSFKYLVLETYIRLACNDECELVYLLWLVTMQSTACRTSNAFLKSL
jgi:hypothetical protein